MMFLDCVIDMHILVYWCIGNWNRFLFSQVLTTIVLSHLTATQLKWKCFDTAISKITDHWSVEPIKVAKNREKFCNMVTCLVEVVKMGLHLERAILPVLPQNIASKPKPEKEEIISKLKTSFNKM